MKYVISGIPVPCKDCEERHEACHDSCERYAVYKQKIQEAKNNRAEALRWAKPNAITRTKPRGKKL